MDVLGVLLIYRTLPLALRALGSRAYISVKPLAAVLQYINALVYIWLIIKFASTKMRGYVFYCLIGIFMISFSNVNFYSYGCTVNMEIFAEPNSYTVHDMVVM